MGDRQATPKRHLSRLKWLTLSLCVILLDQFTKLWVTQQVLLGQAFTVCPGFNIRLAHNTGAAFSVLSEASGWQTFFLSALAICVCLYLLHYLVHTQSRLLAFGISFIIGGALGNLSDRVQWHYVIDFIDWHYGDWHWPTFNLADCAIVFGVIVLVFCVLRHEV